MYHGVFPYLIAIRRMLYSTALSISHRHFSKPLCGEHIGTPMVAPEVSPERTCMLGRFPVVLMVCPP